MDDKKRKAEQRTKYHSSLILLAYCTLVCEFG
jgi:hypothetical protein